MIKTKKKQTKTDKIKSAYCSLFCNSLINFNNCIKFITAKLSKILSFITNHYQYNFSNEVIRSPNQVKIIKAVTIIY